MSALDLLEDTAIAAGLAHEMGWAQVRRVLDQLPVEDGCRWCSGRLDRFGGDAWLCASCGRIDTDWHRTGAERPNRAQAAEVGRQARESWRLAAARVAAQAPERAAARRTVAA